MRKRNCRSSLENMLKCRRRRRQSCHSFSFLSFPRIPNNRAFPPRGFINFGNRPYGKLVAAAGMRKWLMSKYYLTLPMSLTHQFQLRTHTSWMLKEDEKARRRFLAAARLPKATKIALAKIPPGNILELPADFWHQPRLAQVPGLPSLSKSNHQV